MYFAKMLREFVCVVLTSWTLLHLVGGNDLPPPCSSEIYCHGTLLDTIQMAGIYRDSKTFVDLKMKYPPNETLQRFYTFMEETGLRPDTTQIYDFVNETFDPAGSEFEDWRPNDWVHYPKYLDNVKDLTFRDWGVKLNMLWNLLGRKMKEEVREHQDLYSIIWVPNPVIVPGGRFREFYYWDSYWIIKALMLSEMHETAKGMLENFLYMVDLYGFIPNGGRIYYTRRTQPPFLVPMVKEYYESTGDLNFIRENIATMDKEFDFWMTNHTTVVTIDDQNYTLAVYGDSSVGPRPESYREDVDSAKIFPEHVKKEEYYSELKAAAESGWDFSSRWFIVNSTNKGNLTNLSTRNIAPVDLNAFIYRNAVILKEFYELLNDTAKVQYYEKWANRWMEAVTKVLWHDEVGAWLDYDLQNKVKRDYFYPSNVVPLWAGCYEPQNREHVAERVRKYLDNKKMSNYRGGVPTSFEHTGEQWDFPNAWPPLQHMMIIGLDNTGDDYLKEVAFQLAVTWVRSNYKAYNDTGAMFEKYDATVPGGHGGGGEYEIQLGFGWTNGIIMDLLNKYGDRLFLEDPVIEDEPVASEKQEGVISYQRDDGELMNSASTFGQVLTGLLALLVSLTAGFIG